jgi:bilirubin oxidase
VPKVATNRRRLLSVPRWADRAVAGPIVAAWLAGIVPASSVTETAIPPVGRARLLSGDTLTSPPILANLSHTPGIVEVRLTAAPARLALTPGHPTDAYAFNGSVPGPTLELREGDSVIIHFRNELRMPTTVHWHGLHLPANADGSPLRPVPPHGRQDYVFRLGRGTAGTYWYHPHPDRTTTEQVAKGLFGALIVRAADDPLAGIPERLLILSDNRFRPDGSVDFPDPRSLQEQIDEENGREGNVLLVNGQRMPTIAMRAGQVERWRIVNAAAARVYRLAIPGQTLVHVGNDGGLFETPREVKDLLLANSGRAEILVRAGEAKRSAVLQTLPYDRYDPHTRPADWDQPRNLLGLEYTSEPFGDEATIPEKLHVVPPIDTSRVRAHRVVVFSQGLIDGKRMDMERVDITARLGTTEIWQIQNVVGMDHPFHLHGFHFQVLDRDGVPESYTSWHDTVNIPKHSTVRIVIHFDDFPGKWMYHCHILNHEDMGMMGILLVH